MTDQITEKSRSLTRLFSCTNMLALLVPIATSHTSHHITCVTYQHGGSQVKFAEELCDEDVDFHQSFAICLFNLPDQVSEPLILILCACDPDEVKLGGESNKGGRVNSKVTHMYTV